MASHAHDEYIEDCIHCQPTILDLSGARLSEDAPAMRALRRAWKRVPMATKRKYFQFTVRNIHSEENFAAMREIQGYFEEEAQKEVS